MESVCGNEYQTVSLKDYGPSVRTSISVINNKWMKLREKRNFKYPELLLCSVLYMLHQLPTYKDNLLLLFLLYRV